MKESLSTDMLVGLALLLVVVLVALVVSLVIFGMGAANKRAAKDASDSPSTSA